MRKKIFFIIAIILIGFIVIEKNIQMTNNIKIYNVGVDSCCTYLINNFVDNDSQPNNFIEDNSIKYEYRSVNWNSEKIEEYCENLSLQNRVVQYPIVVQEWNKEVTIDTNNLDVETIKQLMVNEFIDNYGKCFSVRLGMSRTIDNYSEDRKSVV